MNERAEKFRQQLQKELGLTISPKDPILAEWLAHEEFKEELAAEHQRMLVALEEALRKNEALWIESAKNLANQSLNAALRAARESTAALIEEAGRSQRPAAVRAALERGVERLEKAAVRLARLSWVVDLKLKDFQVAASKKRLIATLKCCCRCQQLSRQLLVLFGELGHAVIGPRWLIAFGFGRLFHDDGITVKPGEFVGQCNELIVGCSDPNFVQIGHVSHHAINDGIWVIDALGGKLLHVLIDLRCKSAKFIHAHALLRGCLKSPANAKFTDVVRASCQLSGS